MPDRYDAIIIGAGPNGIAAAIAVARAGRSVLVLEAADTPGGGVRSSGLTLPGFIHDNCSAIYPLGIGSPFFKTLPLAEHGLKWVHPPAPFAHPLDDGPAVLLDRSLDVTADRLGEDGAAYRRLLGPFVHVWDDLAADILAPLSIPQHPVLAAQFGLLGMRSARGLAEARFGSERVRAMFAGAAAHSALPLNKPLSAAIPLALAITGHAVGWPFPAGGAQSLTNALVSYLRSLGAEVVTNNRVDLLEALPSHRALLCDLTPREFLRIAGNRLPAGYRDSLQRYRYGPAAFKLDWALDGPIPWKDPAVANAGTVHLGGTLGEIASSEGDVWKGRHAEQPYVLLAQQSLFDPARAPDGKHTAWAYCHVPNASIVDMTDRMERQVERFAPGFRGRILARRVTTPPAFEVYNANYAGGDVLGGVQDIGQLFTRPTVRLDPYSTPLPGVFLCSAATPPGAGVHGMCGYHAARSALRWLDKRLAFGG